MMSPRTVCIVMGFAVGLTTGCGRSPADSDGQGDWGTIPQLQFRMATGQVTTRSLVERYFVRRGDPNSPDAQAALARADALDRERTETGPRGPLHGILVIVEDAAAEPPLALDPLLQAGALLLDSSGADAIRAVVDGDASAVVRSPSAPTASAAARWFLVGFKPSARVSAGDEARNTITASPGLIARSVFDVAIVLGVVAPPPAGAVSAGLPTTLADDYLTTLLADVSGTRLGIDRPLAVASNPDLAAAGKTALAALAARGAVLVGPIGPERASGLAGAPGRLEDAMDGYAVEAIVGLAEGSGPSSEVEPADEPLPRSTAESEGLPQVTVPFRIAGGGSAGLSVVGRRMSEPALVGLAFIIERTFQTVQSGGVSDGGAPSIPGEIPGQTARKR